VVAPFKAAAATSTTTPAKRKLVLLAARTAINATVAHAASEAKPIDGALVVEVMNLLTSSCAGPAQPAPGLHADPSLQLSRAELPPPRATPWRGGSLCGGQWLAARVL
jgi:hypothetical protein